MPRHAFAAAMLAALLAACGGSSPSTSSTSSTTSATTSSPTTATSTVSAGPTATATSTASAGPTASATTSSRPPEILKDKAPKHSQPTAPNTNVRIPAAFTIAAGGGVMPPVISVPPKVTIELQLHNRDATAHRVTLSKLPFAGVAVPARATATGDVAGVPEGTYRLLVDGAARARIFVGAVPGP